MVIQFLSATIPGNYYPEVQPCIVVQNYFLHGVHCRHIGYLAIFHAHHFHQSHHMWGTMDPLHRNRVQHPDNHHRNQMHTTPSHNSA